MHVYRAEPAVEIIREGDGGDFMLMVVKGRVEVHKRDRWNTPQVLASVEAGRTLGEMSMIDGAARFATCVAMEATLVAVLDRESLARIIVEQPLLGAKILMQLVLMLSPPVLEDVIAFLARSGAATLDITGGAPELHPQFRSLVSRARRLGKHVIDRCNLTILQEPGQDDLAAFLAAEQVEIIASLPCYTLELVERQRGAGVYERSIAALRTLNALGYGQPGSGLELHLVYNPQGPSLPPPQAT